MLLIVCHIQHICCVSHFYYYFFKPPLKAAGMRIDEGSLTAASFIIVFWKEPHSPVEGIWTGIGTKMSFSLALR